MTKAVLLGGNGYIGRATNEAWMKADPETEFYVISRSGRNKLTDKRIHQFNEQMLATTEDARPRWWSGWPKNTRPRRWALLPAGLGPKSFVQGKADLVKFLQDSSVPLAYISPTLVYGNGR